MLGTCHRVHVWVFIGLLAGCGEDGARRLADASENVEETSSGADAGGEPDDGDDAGEDSEPEADAEQGQEGDGGANASGADAEPSGARDAGGADAGAPGNALGTECHDFDFDGPQHLVQHQMVGAHWPASAGGSIAPGTYDLVSEQRFIAPDATPEQADTCDDYDGAYWERIVLTDSEWSLLHRTESHTVGRQIFRYSTQDGKVERTLTCPEPDPNQPPQEPRSYSASGDELLLFDELHEDGRPPYCEYLFTYVRKP